MAFVDFIKRMVRRVFPDKTKLENKLEVRIATSDRMDDAIELWKLMYQNTPPWLGEEGQVRSLNIPAMVAEEMARLTMTEFQFDITEGDRAEYIKKQMEDFIGNMPNTVEMWAALGGIVIKPYAVDTSGNGQLDRIFIDVVQANRCYPTAYSSNKKITGMVFVDSKMVGEYLYTRLEHHELVGTTYTVTNKAYRSEKITDKTSDDYFFSVIDPFAEEISLSTVDSWAGLQEETVINDLDSPLFVYVKVPRANNIDPDSPLGASVYARSVTTIEEADRQFSRILWEYEATEAALDIDESLLEQDVNGNPVLPEGRERLYRTYDFEGESNAGFLKEYAPEIRDSSLFNGLNEMMRKIELQCGLAYGTLSNMDDVAKTATEIKASKQRSYTTISLMQTAWTSAMEEIVHVIDAYCNLYQMAPAGEYEVQCTWGDGVLEDAEQEYQRRWSMVMANKLKIEKFYAWYFGISEEEAKEMVPDQLAFPVYE